jgi:hypothetical protein
MVDSPCAGRMMINPGNLDFMGKICEALNFARNVPIIDLHIIN